MFWSRILLISSAVSALASASVEGQKPLNSPSTSKISEGQVLPIQFELREIFHHGTNHYFGLHRHAKAASENKLWSATSDLKRRDNVEESDLYNILPSQTTIERLATREPGFLHTLLAEGQTGTERWVEDIVSSPDATDKSTVISLARMALNAYYQDPNADEWEDIGRGFNQTGDFGWEDDGLKGHVFADASNSTVVIAMKGTSAPFTDPMGTVSNDKVNDNLLFSCCCGQGGRWLWHKVCDCETESMTANSTCLAEALRDNTTYYYAALELYHNVTERYPNAEIWLTGHSLGGSIASLLGLTFGQPVVTFEAPAEALAASRLNLPKPPGYKHGTQRVQRRNTGVYHFGHTADDIFMGNCNAWNSICTFGGYAMETKCHSGSVCVYDTVKDREWSPNARGNHQIKTVLDEVLRWYDDIAPCEVQTDCRDCADWTFE